MKNGVLSVISKFTCICRANPISSYKQFGLIKDFLVSFCCGGGFGGNTFLKILIGTGGVLPDVDDLDGFVVTFGGCGIFTDCTDSLVCLIFGGHFVRY